MSKYLYYKRAFLNKSKKQAGAFIIASIEIDNFDKCYTYRDASVAIADCSRIINLEFEFNNKQAISNSVYKLDLIIKTLQEFKVQFEKEAPRAIKEVIEEKKREKAEKKKKKQEKKELDNNK